MADLVQLRDEFEHWTAEINRYCWDNADYAESWWLNLQAFAADVERVVLRDVYRDFYSA